MNIFHDKCSKQRKLLYKHAKLNATVSFQRSRVHSHKFASAMKYGRVGRKEELCKHCAKGDSFEEQKIKTCNVTFLCVKTNLS